VLGLDPDEGAMTRDQIQALDAEFRDWQRRG